MLKLTKYLKKSIVPILAVIALLVVQASCDLALPTYTSNIVNVGIQQGGIERPAFDVVRKSTFDALQLFMNTGDKSLTQNSYRLLDRETLSGEEFDRYVKEYPVLNTEPLYLLEEVKDETLEDLNEAFGKAILIESMLTGDNENAQTIRAQILAQLPEELLMMANGDILSLFRVMPQEKLDQMLDGVDARLADMPQSMIAQSAVGYVKAEYQAVGIDTDALQTRYIVQTGVKMLLIALLGLAVAIFAGFLAAKVAATFGHDVRRLVFRKVVSFSSAEMEKFSTASLITRSTNDVQQVQMIMVMLLRIVCYAPIMAIGGIIKVVNTNLSMTWIIAVGVALILCVVGVLFVTVMPKFKIVQKFVDKLNLIMREILTGLPVIRAFSTAKHEEKRFDKANEDLTKLNIFVNRAMSLMMPLMMLLMNGITLLIVYKGAESINTGGMQVGDMMAFIQYTMQIIMSFLMISMFSIMLPRIEARISGDCGILYLLKVYPINPKNTMT